MQYAGKIAGSKNGRSVRSARQFVGKDIVFIMGFLRDKSLKREFEGGALIINPPEALLLRGAAGAFCGS